MRINDDLTFTNTDTGGGGVTVKSISCKWRYHNRKWNIRSTSTDHIVLEDETVRGDVYTGDKLVQESGTGSGDITDIRIINSGSGYTSLPTTVVGTGSGGSGSSK